MWFRKRQTDIEMEGMRGKKEEEESLQDRDSIETDYQPVDWKKLLLSPKYIPWWILFICAAIVTVLITIHHDAVVAKLRPWSEKVRDLPGGFLIPIAILFVISFPPLFGHEIIALLCGVVYGLWIGFAIVAAGTFLGEIGTWFAFKSLFRKKAEKLERTNLNYGAMARLTREGGFLVVLIIRFSAIPAHFSTAVFSTCDVKFWHFLVATFCSLPKQIILVYLGVLLVQQGNDKVVKTLTFVIGFLITIGMGAWIWWKMKAIKKVLIEEQEQRNIRKSEPVEMVPDIKAAFQKRYDEDEPQQNQYEPGESQQRRYEESPERRYEGESQQNRYEQGESQQRRYEESPERRYEGEPQQRRYQQEAQGEPREWMMQPAEPTRLV